MKLRNSAVCFIMSVLTVFSARSLGEVSDVSGFGAVIILDQGRKKPLDTYARSLLLRFSGKQRYKGGSASAWLARLLFTPDEAASDTVFMVNDMQVIEAMGLSLQESRHFSFTQLEGGLEKLQGLAGEISKVDEKERTRLQADIMRLYYNIRVYFGLRQSFHFALPEQVFSVQDPGLAARLGLPPSPAENSFFTMQSLGGLLDQYMAAGENEELVSEAGKAEAGQLRRKLMQWSKHYVNMPVEILPIPGDEAWQSPWDALNSMAGRKILEEELGTLVRMAQSFRSGRQAEFDLAAGAFRAFIEHRVSDAKLMSKIRLELRYNKVNPFLWSKIILGFGLLLSLAAMVFWGRPLYLAGLGVTIAGLLPLAWGMWSRMIIMGRPPVTNLYETFLFVGLTSVVLGLCMEWVQRRGLGLVTAGFSGLLMLMIAGKYAREGDTMGMLVAVLDSNFWLATHVITITMGYGGCVAAGVAGHAYILQELFNAGEEKLKNTGKTIYGVLAFGLIFTFIGTVLGGIWADQSWGRFWGWDPKENGALLIVLWCAILFHARLDGMIKNLGLAAGSVIGVLIVMFAWFGVNLLGVGLHSYGFSGGVFWKLIIYYALEVIFLFFSVGWIYQKRVLKKNIAIQ